MSKKSFTVIELLLVVAIVGLLASIVLVFLNGARAQARDAKRKAEVDAIRKTAEFYYIEHAHYPKKTEWAKLEEDPVLDTGEHFSEAVKEWLPTIPKDPLYGQTKEREEPYSYQYKTTDDATNYKIHVEMETGAYVAYETYSSGGGGIVYGVEGPTGSVLAFDGTDDYVKVPNSASLNITEAITMEIWIKPKLAAAKNNWITVIGKQSNNDEAGYNLFVDEDQDTIYFHVDTAGGDIFTNYTFPVMDEWYHVVGTFEKGPVMKLYINGELKNDTPQTFGSGPFDGPIGTTTKPLYFGGDPEDSSAAPYQFKGEIDKIRIYNRVLSASEVNEHYKEIFTDETGLKGLWKLDEGSGITVADSSGNGNDGILIRLPSGYALQFDGDDDYINVDDSDSLDITDAISIEVWMKRDSVTSTPDWRTVIAKQATENEAYGIIVNNDQSRIYFFVQGPGGGVSWTEYSSTSTIGEWQHVVGTWNRDVGVNNMFLYINYGENDKGAVFTDPIVTSSLPLFMGGDTGTGYAPYEFKGALDEVRIYAKALPPSLVQKHYLGDYSEDNTSCNGDCDLRALWHFDEGSGTTTGDASGKGNTGTLINNPQWIVSEPGPQWVAY